MNILKLIIFSLSSLFFSQLVNANTLLCNGLKVKNFINIAPNFFYQKECGSTEINPFSTIEAEDYCEQFGVTVDNENTIVENIENGDWIKYKNLNFETGVNSISLLASSNTTGGKIEIREASINGPVIGIVEIKNTGGWGNYKTVTTKINTVSDVKDIYFVFKGSEKENLFNLNSFNFSLENIETEIAKAY